jgi:hypothetical protein
LRLNEQKSNFGARDYSAGVMIGPARGSRCTTLSLNIHVTTSWMHPKPKKRNLCVSILYPRIHPTKKPQTSLRESIANLETQQAQLESELASTTSQLKYVLFPFSGYESSYEISAMSYEI